MRSFSNTCKPIPRLPPVNTATFDGCSNRAEQTTRKKWLGSWFCTILRFCLKNVLTQVQGSEHRQHSVTFQPPQITSKLTNSVTETEQDVFGVGHDCMVGNYRVVFPVAKALTQVLRRRHD